MRHANIEALTSSPLHEGKSSRSLSPTAGGLLLLEPPAKKLFGRHQPRDRGLTLPIGCNNLVRVSAKAILKRRPCAFSNDFAKDSMNSAPSSNASGGQTC